MQLCVSVQVEFLCIYEVQITQSQQIVFLRLFN